MHFAAGGEEDSGVSLQVDAQMPLVYTAFKYKGEKKVTWIIF